MDLFDQMAVDYSEGTGSVMASAKLEAEDLTGSLRSLSNSWTEFVSHVAGSGELKAGVDLLDSLVQGLSRLAEFVTPAGMAGLGAGLIASFKNAGRAECSPSDRICLL